jgi:uncharacterized membrane protein
MSRLSLAAFVVTLGLLACGEEDSPPLCGDHAHAEEGTQTGATCGSSDLTYENFGRQFMEDYCTGCHSSAVEGEARNCAPDDHNFDTLDGVLLAREHIDEQAGAGPSAVNDHMPPSGVTPTEAERRDLSTWLACEEERMP